MRGEDFTSDSFCADHYDMATGHRHGHTWHVEIYWPAEPFVDARLLREKLTSLTGIWDHRVLEEVGIPESTNYGVARAVSAAIPGLSRVRVSRSGKTPCGCEFFPGA